MYFHKLVVLALREFADLLTAPLEPEGGTVVFSDSESAGTTGGEGAVTAPS